LERRGKAEILEDAGTEVRREVSHAIEGVDDERPKRIELMPDGWIGRHSLDELKAYQQKRERLTGVVVELARDPDTLGLLGRQDPRREGARAAAIDLQLGDRSRHGPTVGPTGGTGIRRSALILGP